MTVHPFLRWLPPDARPAAAPTISAVTTPDVTTPHDVGVVTSRSAVITEAMFTIVKGIENELRDLEQRAERQPTGEAARILSLLFELAQTFTHKRERYPGRDPYDTSDDGDDTEPEETAVVIAQRAEAAAYAAWSASGTDADWEALEAARARLSEAEANEATRIDRSA